MHLWNPAATAEHVLTVDCAESPGIVHAVSGFLLNHGCDILDIKQYGDKGQRHFFMRVHFSSGSSDASSGQERLVSPSHEGPSA